MLCNDIKFTTLLCPITPQAVKLVNKFIKILFESRKKLDDGCSVEDLGYRQFDPNYSLN